MKTTTAPREKAARSKSGLLLDVSALGEEFGPHARFWREVLSRRLLPTVRPDGFRRVFVRRADVEQLIESWTDPPEAGL